MARRASRSRNVVASGVMGCGMRRGRREASTSELRGSSTCVSSVGGMGTSSAAPAPAISGPESTRASCAASARSMRSTIDSAHTRPGSPPHSMNATYPGVGGLAHPSRRSTACRACHARIRTSLSGDTSSPRARRRAHATVAGRSPSPPWPCSNSSTPRANASRTPFGGAKSRSGYCDALRRARASPSEASNSTSGISTSTTPTGVVPAGCTGGVALDAVTGRSAGVRVRERVRRVGIGGLRERGGYP